MRVRLARVEHRLDERLELRDDELLTLEQAGLDPIDGAEPALRVGPRDVPALDGGSVRLEVRTQTRELRELHEPPVVPRIHEVSARPVGRTVVGVARHQQRQQPVCLDQTRVLGEVHLIDTGGDADAHAGAGRLRLERLEPAFEIRDESEIRRVAGGPRCAGVEPCRKLRCTDRRRIEALAARPRPLQKGSGVLLAERLPRVSQHCRRLWRAPDDRHRRVGRDRLLEGGDVVHAHDRLDGEVRRHEISKASAVLVVHPAVGDDEPEHPVWRE